MVLVRTKPCTFYTCVAETASLSETQLALTSIGIRYILLNRHEIDIFCVNGIAIALLSVTLIPSLQKMPTRQFAAYKPANQF